MTIVTVTNYATLVTAVNKMTSVTAMIKMTAMTALTVQQTYKLCHEPSLGIELERMGRSEVREQTPHIPTPVLRTPVQKTPVQKTHVLKTPVLDTSCPRDMSPVSNIRKIHLAETWPRPVYLLLEMAQ